VASVHVLAASDRLRLREDPGTDAQANYDDRYLWLNLRGAVTPKLFAQSVLSYGSLARDRSGAYDNEIDSQSGALEDRRSMNFVALKNDAMLDLSARNVLKFGATAKRLRARYDYEGAAHVEFSTFELGSPPRDVVRSIHARPTGNELALYVADRFRVSERVIVEAGVRAGSESWTPGGMHVSPRLNASWMLRPRTSIRAAWGLYHQAQSIHELQVEDGESAFSRAQRSEHRVLGLEHLFVNHMHARLELYEKVMTSLRPRYENLYDNLLLFPELRADRVRIAPDRGTARGMELLVRTDTSQPVSGWISYTLASANDVFDDVEVPRSWDQRHAVTASVNYRRAVWNVNVAGTMHSGWPTTPVVASVEGNRIVSSTGPRSSTRLPAYHRVDVRITRASGPLSLFVEVLNVLDHTNVTRVDGFDFNVTDGNVTAIGRQESVLGILPSFGVTWRF
jgi:hypothetical protein